ncbi:hypothetical protein Anas_04616 [Armadillidium nasatum]|uniref:Uncharacterized protein n=1 Tax=Armadillidium nasatum TaxID=96803 RepID=A0A5N5SJA7_9CRUS|nr:hypothetical protein Anas_04616 [Armadillidium nasatum]
MKKPKFYRQNRAMILRRYTRPTHHDICFTHENVKSFGVNSSFSVDLNLNKLSVPEQNYIQLYKWYNVKYIVIDVMCLTTQNEIKKPKVPYLKYCFNSDQFTDYGIEIVKSKSSSVTHAPRLGAGSAGAVVASRLSENPDFEVLLLEAGDGETGITYTPALSSFSYQTEQDWNFTTESSSKFCLAMNSSVKSRSIINICQ